MMSEPLLDVSARIPNGHRLASGSIEGTSFAWDVARLK
jgi:hypothetical protein